MVSHLSGGTEKFFQAEQNHVYFSSCIGDPSKYVQKSLNQQLWFIFSREIMVVVVFFKKKYFAVLNLARPAQ